MTPRRPPHTRRPRGEVSRQPERLRRETPLTEAERFAEILAGDDAEPALAPLPDSSTHATADEPVPERPATRESRGATSWRWQIGLFLATFGLGWLLLQWKIPTMPVRPAPEPAPPPKPMPYRLTPEVFDWLAELRETQVVTDDLEAQFAQAQQFYRDNPVDAFLALDPWTLPWEQVSTLTTFCDRGFFTVEREILVKLLENRLVRGDAPPGPLDTASARLAQAAQERKNRLADLQDAMTLYRRGREDETVVQTPPATPEEDQAARAALVEKMLAARKHRTELDQRITELQALLAK